MGATVQIAAWLAVGMALGGCAGDAAAPLAACRDADRQAITHASVDACAGAVLDPARAAEIATAQRDERIRRVLAQAPPSAQLDRLAGRGTGFFVDSAGAILTGGHVVAACRAISIALADGAERWVRVVATDARQDLALLHGADTAPAAAVFHPEPREAPLVDLNLIGFPGRAAQPTATPVALSSDQRLAAAEQYRFQADVHRGHSGAPILDASGRVIGVVRAMIAPASADRTGEPVVGELGLAVANPAVLAFLDAHGVRYRTAAPTPSDSAPLTRARRFLVQVRCWR